MTIQTDFEILSRAAQILKSCVEDKQKKAFELFSKATADIRGSVYGNLHQQMNPSPTYWGWGEHSFHDQNGLKSTPEQKAQALEAQLSQMVAVMRLKGAPNLKDTYYFLGHVAEQLVSRPEEGMRLFDKLPQEIRTEVYQELGGVLPLARAQDAFHDRNGLTSLPSLKALAIEFSLLRNVRDLFQRDHALAIDLFKRIRPLHHAQVYAKFRWLIDGIAQLPIEPIFETPQADPLYPQKKGEAIDKYLSQFQQSSRSRVLEWCEAKLGVVSHQPSDKDATELVQKLVRTEPAMSVRTAAEDRFGLGQIFEEHPFQSVGDRSFTDRFCNLFGAKLLIHGQFYFPITSGTQRFSQQRLVSCGDAEHREQLFLDPNNCPELDLHYGAFRQALSAEMSTEEILSKLKEYLRNKMFTSRKPQIEAVRAYNATISAIPARITRHKDHLNWNISMISIDDYVHQGIGVDRHHALAACYFIDRLLSETHPLLQGTVQFMKCNLADDGAHIVTTFVPMRQMGDPGQKAWKQHQEAPPEKWLLDCYRDVLMNFANPHERIELRSLHAVPVDQLVQKSAPAAEKNGQPVS